jgi:hypothetical protein
MRCRLHVHSRSRRRSLPPLDFRLASLVVGKGDLAAVECGEQATEGVGLTGVCARIGQLVGLKVLLDAGEPTEQLVAEDLRLGGRKVDRRQALGRC